MKRQEGAASNLGLLEPIIEDVKEKVFMGNIHNKLSYSYRLVIFHIKDFPYKVGIFKNNNPLYVIE